VQLGMQVMILIHWVCSILVYIMLGKILLLRWAQSLVSISDTNSDKASGLAEVLNLGLRSYQILPLRSSPCPKRGPYYSQTWLFRNAIYQNPPYYRLASPTLQNFAGYNGKPWYNVFRNEMYVFRNIQIVVLG
jgi:hypothetical protein